LGEAEVDGIVDLRGTHLAGDLDLGLRAVSQFMLDGVRADKDSTLRLPVEFEPTVWSEERVFSQVLHDT
jgi:hypothetical protein